MKASVVSTKDLTEWYLEALKEDNKTLVKELHENGIAHVDNLIERIVPLLTKENDKDDQQKAEEERKKAEEEQKANNDKLKDMEKTYKANLSNMEDAFN